MSDDPATALAAPTAASVLLTNCLVRHLEAKGFLSRTEFIGYLDETAEALEGQGQDRLVLHLFRTFAASIRGDDPSKALN